LIKTVAGLTDEVFHSRVNQSKNEYADWVMKTIGDESLYASLKSQTDKDSLIRVLNSEIDRLKHVSIAANSYATASTSSANVPSAVIAAPITASVSSSTGSSNLNAQNISLSSQDNKSLSPDNMLSSPDNRSIHHELTHHELTNHELIHKESIQQKSDHREVLEKLKQIKRINTGVSGFDDMIDVGIPVGSVILVSGGPGSGKTTFCMQMLGLAAEHGEKCLFISLEETADRLIEHMESYGFNPKKYIAEGTLIIQHQDPFKISRSVETLLAYSRANLFIDTEEVLDIVPEGFKPDRIVIDSLSAIASAFNESSIMYRMYIYQLITSLSRTGATSFLIKEIHGIEDIGHGLVEEFLSDGIVMFYNLQHENSRQNALEILKMRAVNHEKKIVPFEFVEGKGLVVYPLEKLFS
jgi:KaiC/GvpD/RAD55 family RecA-like ATPase